jgi:hypothetical protein
MKKFFDLTGDDIFYQKYKPTNAGIYIETDKKASLQNTYPNWMDDRFKEPRIIYLESEKYHPDNKTEKKNYGFDYSDRLWEWDYKKSETAWEKAKLDFKELENRNKTAEFYERYLQYYFDDPELTLHCILSGVNVSNGYPYLVYGYTHKGK